MRNELFSKYCACIQYEDIGVHEHLTSTGQQLRKGMLEEYMWCARAKQMYQLGGFANFQCADKNLDKPPQAQWLRRLSISL